jgi:phosphoglycolate phosphatase-like HAD superfamily hydrolase
MSGGLFVNALLGEIWHQVTAEEAARLGRVHAEAYARLVTQVRPLPGARELLDYLTQANVPWTIATSGRMESARPALEILGVKPETPLARAAIHLSVGGGTRRSPQRVNSCHLSN